MNRNQPSRFDVSVAAALLLGLASQAGAVVAKSGASRAPLGTAVPSAAPGLKLMANSLAAAPLSLAPSPAPLGGFFPLTAHGTEESVTVQGRQQGDWRVDIDYTPGTPESQPALTIERRASFEELRGLAAALRERAEPGLAVFAALLPDLTAAQERYEARRPYQGDQAFQLSRFEPAEAVNRGNGTVLLKGSVGGRPVEIVAYEKVRGFDKKILLRWALGRGELFELRQELEYKAARSYGRLSALYRRMIRGISAALGDGR